MRICLSIRILKYNKMRFFNLFFCGLEINPQVSLKMCSNIFVIYVGLELSVHKF